MTNNRGLDYKDLWRIFREQEIYREQILHWMNLSKNLPILPWDIQVEVLENAPEDIIKAHSKILHDKAKVKLGLKEEKEKKWTFNSLL